ncbi:4-hydroxy-tetrahydrodipicolinate reductase [Robiginitalea aurantiaca]|uniref:4-hydroxy-tetrahydrodipicolinate reductase n=1 Tax=Robiginitalea aurantiaca TaxID=3056915 RepID=A0ABT7WGM2_9FLAO|nr:4-hydroxy-tetrahydrodipicolinate reductase [Robiginitalea aurantiaca]MDM9632068.1 4-hydroxy-tetrahydrodipicolinate reductase [Robiginitalea aurantiaca]
MRIVLFGYGTMGKMIDRIATARNHKIVSRIDTPGDIPPFGELDVAIDFSTPDSALGNISACLENGVPVVSGTTGWLDGFPKAELLCRQQNGAFLYASNFSLGVNLFFELNAHLARMMSGFPDYAPTMTEIHHTRKLDAPSGTAITLAEGIIENSTYTAWDSERSSSETIPITSERIGDTPGTHRIAYDSEVDRIEIQHTAHNREGFALGAVLAAEWLIGKKGVFGMRDVLNLR